MVRDGERKEIEPKAVRDMLRSRRFRPRRKPMVRTGGQDGQIVEASHRFRQADDPAQMALETMNIVKRSPSVDFRE